MVELSRFVRVGVWLECVVKAAREVQKKTGERVGRYCGWVLDTPSAKGIYVSERVHQMHSPDEV